MADSSAWTKQERVVVAPEAVALGEAQEEADSEATEGEVDDLTHEVHG